MDDNERMTLDIIRHTARRAQQVISDGVELIEGRENSIRLLFYILDDLALVTMVALCSVVPAEKRSHAFTLKMVQDTLKASVSSPKARAFFAEMHGKVNAAEMLQRILDAQAGSNPPTDKST